MSEEYTEQELQLAREHTEVDPSAVAKLLGTWRRMALENAAKVCEGFAADMDQVHESDNALVLRECAKRIRGLK